MEIKTQNELFLYVINSDQYFIHRNLQAEDLSNLSNTKPLLQTYTLIRTCLLTNKCFWQY